jgi:putative transposase
MRKKRDFKVGAVYHITSRTNDKVPVFERRLGRKIMMRSLEAAKAKFGFRLYNFCVMPTHIHLLIRPTGGGNPSQIMHWIKTQSSKHWNNVHGASNHLWGNRFFARAIKNDGDFLAVMAYIDKNPVKAGLTLCVGDWEDSGAYHIRQNITTLADFDPYTRLLYMNTRLLLAAPK